MDSRKHIGILSEDASEASREIELTFFAAPDRGLTVFIEQDNPSSDSPHNRDIVMLSRAQLLAFVDLATEALATMGHPEAAA